MTIVKSHIRHPYENKDLTFRELKNILLSFSEPENVECYEKFDGVALYVTYDFISNVLRIARNKSHIASGGLVLSNISGEFADRPALRDLLTKVYMVLNKAIAPLDDRTKYEMFGSTGGIWFIAEIITPDFTNTIKYADNCVVFHKYGAKFFGFNGEEIVTDLSRNVDALTKNIYKLSENIKDIDWFILPPMKMMMNKPSNDMIKNLIKEMDNLLVINKLNSGNTIKDYLYATLIREMERYPIINAIIRSLVIKNLIGFEGVPTLKQITSGLDKLLIDQVNQMVSDINKTILNAMYPIENAFYLLGKDLFKNLKSSHVDDYDVEISRIKSELTKCISEIDSAADQKGKNIIQKNIQKLKTAENVDSCIEGIVFRHKLDLYKLTGVFAPVNAICGYVKYNLNKPQDCAPKTKDKTGLLYFSAG